MTTITPFLWFNKDLAEALDHYSAIFPDFRIIETRNTSNGQTEELFTASFEMAGQRFMALNGGPHFTFNEAISLFVECSGQEEVDHFWNYLTDNGGKEERCGWLKDKYGISWQIIPKDLGKLLGDPDAAKASRVMQAMLAMNKIEIEKLYIAYRG